MSEKKNSAAQRVFRSVVGPAISTSLALFLGCSTATPSKDPQPTDRPTPVKQPDHLIPIPGQATTTQGASVSPVSAPASSPVIVPALVPKPGIRKVGSDTFDPRVGFKSEARQGEVNWRSGERPSRKTRRTTDEDGGVLHTGFVGGRTLK